MATCNEEIDFCTLGMFIIDEIEFPLPKPPVKDIVGGAGSYSALGARIFSPAPKSKSVGWIVDCGSDFPPELREFIAQWETGVVIRETPDRLTTRGWNGYGEHEHREPDIDLHFNPARQPSCAYYNPEILLKFKQTPEDTQATVLGRKKLQYLIRTKHIRQGLTCVAFKYTTPKLRLDHEALVDTSLLWSKSFHLICSPLRCIDLVENILALRERASDSASSLRPLFIWEPVPDLCIPDEYYNCLKALKCVDVVSPNNGELGGFFGEETMVGDHVNYRMIESLCNQWLEDGIGTNGTGGIVVRCGKDGCLMTRRGQRAWMPAYHQSPEKVVDPTGGGNGFLGGLAVGLVRGVTPGVHNLGKAVIWGSIAASFAIEQVGMPVLQKIKNEETWNGVKVEDRLAEYKHLVDRYIQP